MFISLAAHWIISQECFILERIPRGGLYVVGLTLTARENDSFYSAKHVESLSVGNDGSSQSKLDLKEQIQSDIFPSSICKFFLII